MFKLKDLLCDFHSYLLEDLQWYLEDEAVQDKYWKDLVASLEIQYNGNVPGEIWDQLGQVL